MRLTYDSKQPYKGSIVVQPGATVDVPDDVAEQLQSDPHWKESKDAVGSPTTEAEAEAAAAEAESTAEASEPKKALRPRRKSTGR